MLRVGRKPLLRRCRIFRCPTLKGALEGTADPALRGLFGEIFNGSFRIDLVPTSPERCPLSGEANTELIGL